MAFVCVYVQKYSHNSSLHDHFLTAVYLSKADSIIVVSLMLMYVNDLCSN